MDSFSEDAIDEPRMISIPFELNKKCSCSAKAMIGFILREFKFLQIEIQ